MRQVWANRHGKEGSAPALPSGTARCYGVVIGIQACADGFNYH